MKTLLLVVLLVLPVTAHATTLDFEVGGDPISQLNSVTQHYGGLDWSGSWYTLDHSSYVADWGSTLAFPSGDQVLFNGFGLPVLVDTLGEATMTVAGAWFAPWTIDDQWDSEAARTVTMEGWLDDILVGSVSMNLDPGGFRYLATDFGVVDLVRIRAEDSMISRRWFLMDNLDVTLTNGSSECCLFATDVPEPPTWLLLAGGLGVLMGLTYRRSA